MSLLITKSITRPIELLKNKTREIAEGNFEGRLRVQSPPEIAELAAAINSMCEKLQELDRLKADFFASMSHELRTPLTSIKEGTGLLLDGVGGETTDKQRKLLGILAEESNRLINVVNSLLDLSKMEAGMMVYDFEVTQRVDPLIKRAVARSRRSSKPSRFAWKATSTSAASGAARSGADSPGATKFARQRGEVYAQRRSGAHRRQTGQWQIGNFCERLWTGYSGG